MVEIESRKEIVFSARQFAFLGKTWSTHQQLTLCRFIFFFARPRILKYERDTRGTERYRI